LLTARLVAARELRIARMTAARTLPASLKTVKISAKVVENR
jgi:hypothetical protein